MRKLNQQGCGLVLGLVLGLAPLGLAPLVAQAQDFKVLEERGEEIVQGGTTELRFEADGEVSVHRVLSRGVVTGFNVTGQSETSSYVCTAPCKVEVPNGTYELRAGDNFLFAYPFRVEARGAAQRWEVEDSSTTLGLLGIFGSGIGGGLALSGALLSGVEGTEDALGVSNTELIVVGLPMLALGIWALVEAFSGGERIE